MNFHILHTVLSTFFMVMTRRICLTIRSFLNWQSFPLFPLSSWFVQGWYCKEKLDGGHSWGLQCTLLPSMTTNVLVDLSDGNLKPITTWSWSFLHSSANLSCVEMSLDSFHVFLCCEWSFRHRVEMCSDFLSCSYCTYVIV